MNQRSKQLAIEAGLYVDVKGKPWPKWLGAEECEQAYARFAELIVLECVNAVMDGTKEGDHYAQRIEQHFDNGTSGVLHFGVEL